MTLHKVGGPTQGRWMRHWVPYPATWTTPMADPVGMMRRGVRIGVDVGSVRVGVAGSDPEGVLATPIRTLRRTSSNDRVAQVRQIVAQTEAIEVIVGLPRGLSGAEGAAAAAARDYADRIAAAVAPVPVRLVDERLSTVSAHQRLHRAGRGARRPREGVDGGGGGVVLEAGHDPGDRPRPAPGDA